MSYNSKEGLDQAWSLLWCGQYSKQANPPKAFEDQRDKVFQLHALP